MMKRKGIVLTAGIGAVLGAMLLSGCGNTLPEMTDDQADAIGEYAAITLLKYDANSKSRLVDISVLEESAAPELPVITEPDPIQPETAETGPTVTDRTDPSGGVTAATSLEEFMGLPDGMTLTYTGYDVVQSYQEEGDVYFALEASAGKQLLVLSFYLNNQTGAEQPMRLIDLHNSYRVTVNEDYTRTALTTMLNNDLSTYIETLSDGAGRQLVLLYEIDPVQVDTITLKFKNTETTYTMQVK